MVSRQALLPGVWYDGFWWYKGKQRGVDTLKWRGDGFSSLLTGGDGHIIVTPHVDDSTPSGYSFEPNVISERPPTEENIR